MGLEYKVHLHNVLYEEIMNIASMVRSDSRFLCDSWAFWVRRPAWHILDGECVFERDRIASSNLFPFIFSFEQNNPSDFSTRF